MADKLINRTMDMTMYYTIDERFLNAVERYFNGEYAKVKVMLEQILDEEPGFARGHFLLGIIYHHELRDLARAEQSYQYCIRFNPAFTDVYLPFMHLLNAQGRHVQLEQLAQQALGVAGVCNSCVYRILAQSHERNQQFSKALDCYQQAYLLDTNNCTDDLTETKNRLYKKMMLTNGYRYQLC